MPAVLKDSSTLQAAIQRHEGFRSTPYWDVNGYAIGYGQHTNPLTGRPVQPGDFIDKSQADSLLSSAIQPYADTVQRQLGADSWNSLTANQQNALTDYAYNYGSLTPDVKAAVQQYQQTGDASVVGDALIRRGEINNGGILMPRRQDEADAFVNDKPLTGAPGGGSAGKSGAGGPNGAAAGAGGAGGGAGCAGGAMGGVAGMAMGGLMSGAGLGGVMSGVAGQISGAVGGALGGALGGVVSGALQGAITSGVQGLISGQGLSGFMSGAMNGAMGPLMGAMSSLPGVGQLSNIGNAIQGLGGNITNAISSLGSNILPGLGNVLSGPLSQAMNGLMSPLSSVLQTGNIVGVAQQLSAAGGIQGLVARVAGNMAGNFAGGTIQNLISNVQIASGISGVSRGVTAGISEAMGQQFGGGVNGLGALYQNMEGVATFGVSSLANNIGAVAADMINSGKWDTSNLTRLMQPGSIAAQIVNAGLGVSTGILPKLAAANIPIGNIDDPRNDSAIKQILYDITSPAAIGLVKQAFNMNTDVISLGQLTDINAMMPNSASKLPVTNYKDLGMHLTQMQVTKAKDFSEIGSAFLKIESTRDLNHISQMPKPFHEPTGELMLKTFGYGSGTFGETTMADVMGTVAGYVHEDTFPVIIDNVSWLKTRSEATQYFAGVNFLEALLAGKYTSVADGGGEGGGAGSASDVNYTYTVPLNETGYTNGFIGTFSDVGQVTSAGNDIHNLSSSGLEAAVKAVCTYIETGMLTLKNSTDIEIQTAIQAIDTAHNASVSQIVREATLLKAHQIDIFYPQAMTPLSAYGMSMGLQSYATQTGHGQASDFIERIATDDIYGDAMKMTMRQTRNAAVLQELGVNVERFNLPNSQYYRDPLTTVGDMYNSNIPTVPLYTQNIYYPTDLNEQYLQERDAKLADAGYGETTLLPAEKDALYVDEYWKDSPDFIKATLGEMAVNTALNRNLRLLDKSLQIAGTDGIYKEIGMITPDGIQDFDQQTFLDTMLTVAGVVLYGDIGLEDYNNPFRTVEIVYGVSELLEDLNYSTYNRLRDTYLAKKVIGGKLQEMSSALGIVDNVNDTGRDRNDPLPFGGSGPGMDPRFSAHDGGYLDA
jgi:GH24 family phage-related lysozyme (muramidase)